MKKSKSILLALILTSGLGVACDQQVSQSPEKIARPVKAIRVADPNVLQGRWFSGRAKAVNQVDLSFRVPGTLVELPVKVGDKLKKNTVIAQLDPSIYQTEVDRLEAEVSHAEASYENSRLQLERQEILLKRKVTPEARVDRQRAKVQEDRARIKAAKSALKKAELDLEYTTLRTPFDGTVVAVYVENFEDIRAKERAVRLLDPSQIEMVVNIPENLITLAPQVKNIEVVFDVFPDIRIPAEIKELGSEASQTTRTYPLTLIMNLPDDVKILPGMAGKATGKPDAQAANISNIVIPPTSLFKNEEQKNSVWVIDEKEMTVSMRSVDLGTATRTGLRIKSALSPREWIVTAGVHSLEEGQKVRILKEQTE